MKNNNLKNKIFETFDTMINNNSCKLYIVVFNDKKEHADYCAKIELPPEPYDSFRAYTQNVENGVLVHFQIRNNKIEGQTIAHETIHIIDLCYKQIGQININLDENLAYLTGDIFNIILKFLIRKKINII